MYLVTAGITHIALVPSCAFVCSAAFCFVARARTNFVTSPPHTRLHARNRRPTDYCTAVFFFETGTSGRPSSATESLGFWRSSWTPTRRSGLRGRPWRSDERTLPPITRGALCPIFALRYVTLRCDGCCLDGGVLQRCASL